MISKRGQVISLVLIELFIINILEFKWIGLLVQATGRPAFSKITQVK